MNYRTYIDETGLDKSTDLDKLESLAEDRSDEERAEQARELTDKEIEQLKQIKC